MGLDAEFLGLGTATRVWSARWSRHSRSFRLHTSISSVSGHMQIGCQAGNRRRYAWGCESSSRLVCQSLTPDCTPLCRDHTDPGNHARSQQPGQAGQRYVPLPATQSCTELIIPVLYLGVSDTPAWVISRANESGRNHGLPPFVNLKSLSCKNFWAHCTRSSTKVIDPLQPVISSATFPDVSCRGDGYRSLGCDRTRLVPAQGGFWEIQGRQEFGEALGRRG